MRYVNKNAERALRAARTFHEVRELFAAEIAKLGYDWFDAVAMVASLMANPHKATRFFVCNYFNGDPWVYLPPRWPADDEVTIQSTRTSSPIDYLKELKASSQTLPTLYQRGALKTNGVKRAWLFPHNTLGEYRAVTCYVTEARDDQEEHFQSTRDELFVLSAILIDRLEEICTEPLPAQRGAFVVGEMPVQLTKEEIACYSLLLRGKKNPEIAAELGVSVNTVKFHLKKVYKALNVKTRIEAVAVALDHGFHPNPHIPNHPE